MTIDKLILAGVSRLRKGDVVHNLVGSEMVVIGRVVTVEEKGGGWYKISLDNGVTLRHRNTSALWIAQRKP